MSHFKVHFQVYQEVANGVSAYKQLFHVIFHQSKSGYKAVNIISNKMFNTRQCLIMIVVSCLIISTYSRPQNSWRSLRCLQAGATPSPSSCLHGSLSTPCGPVCKKGPSDICGGSGDQYGVCGDGLSCSDCNRCTGCSFTAFKCFSDNSCVSFQDMWL